MSQLTQKELHLVKQLEVKTRQLVHQLFRGEWTSSFKGQGLEFEDLREYIFGDPVRLIDWNVTARMDKPYLRRYKEERQRCFFLMVDVSSSLLFKNKQALKKLAALFAVSALSNNDTLGLLLFSDRIEHVVLPKGGASQGLRLLRDLFYHKPKGKMTNPKKALQFAFSLLKRRSTVFFLSDFLFRPGTLPWGVFAAKHELLAISLTDPLETTMPKLGYLHLQDLETEATTLVPTHHPSVQKELSQARKKTLQAHQKQIKQSGAEFLDLSTEQDFFRELVLFFKRRSKRRR